MTPGAARRLSPDEYEKNLRKLVAKLKKTKATLVWCSTTPIPQKTGIRKKGDAVLYNKIAAKVMRENNIATNDLWTFANPILKEIQRPNNVHFTDSGSSKLGKEVARVLMANIKKR